MRMGFNVQIPTMHMIRNDVKEKSKEVLFRAMVKMEELAKMRVAVDTGNLKNRIHLEPSYIGASAYVLSDGVDYGIHVEYGTKPHYVPITPLVGWAGRVLGDEGLAYAVRAKIALKGTQAQPFFRPALHEVQYKWLPLITAQVYE